MTKKKELTKDNEALPARVTVGMGTCGIAAGAGKVVETLEAAVKELKLNVEVHHTGCLGMCYNEVLIKVERPGEAKIIYGNVTPENVSRIIEEHLRDGHPVKELAVAVEESDKSTALEGIPLTNEVPFFKKQVKNVIRNCGNINPNEIDDYLASGGYRALKKALSKMSPQEIIDEVKGSGLRGRGGGGFPTGIKWESTKNAAGRRKYIICNADEGDPGAFMDRSIIEGDPHSVLEGMVICAYAIGAQRGYVYVRAEYPLAVRRLQRAIEQALDRGFLGKDILSSGFDFFLDVKQGAGAFVCGEETAMINSIEGNRGMPRPRPPFPATKGLWDMPTNINNVETFANIPLIINMGGDKYAETGTVQSKGTKVFALTGKVRNSGLAEVPMGTTLREIIFDIGGGIIGGKKFKGVQIGGPSGGCLSEKHLDLPIDYDSLISAGAMMGSGGLVVFDEDTCMVELARFFMYFMQSESCGKCTPCREGTKRMLEMLTRIVDGKGKVEDIDMLSHLGRNMIDTSLCGLGQSAPNPVLSTLRHFRTEYEMHIEKKICPAGVCRALTSYTILPDRCKGCGICLRECPAKAITGKKKELHKIDPEKCEKCGICLEKCPFGAIARGT